MWTWNTLWQGIWMGLSVGIAIMLLGGLWLAMLLLREKTETMSMWAALDEIRRSPRLALRRAFEKEVMMACRQCDGQGIIGVGGRGHTCPNCGGTGKEPKQ